jgi:hypothetical protein
VARGRRRGTPDVRAHRGPQLNSARVRRGPRAAAALIVGALLVGACTIGDDRPALTFAPDRLPDGTAGQRYEQVITVTGNVTPVFLYSVRTGLLPSGLKIEPVPGSNNMGRIVGTPSVAGSASFEVVATCRGTNVSGQTGTKAYTLTIR